MKLSPVLLPNHTPSIFGYCIVCACLMCVLCFSMPIQLPISLINGVYSMLVCSATPVFSIEVVSSRLVCFLASIISLVESCVVMGMVGYHGSSHTDGQNTALKIKCNVFLFVEVNFSTSVLNINKSCLLYTSPSPRD